MRIAYIVSAYKRPEQLVRLVRCLAGSAAAIAVHVDAKTGKHDFERMVDGTRGLESVRFLTRHACYWGGFGHVAASLKGIAHLAEGRVEYDYAVLLTGQDYPLVPAAQLEQFFARSGGRSYMSYWRLPFAPWTGRGGLDRLEFSHYVGPRHLHVRSPFRRTLPAGLTPFGGSPYWALAAPVVEFVHDLVGRRPEIVRFFERVFIPDELFFQTVIMNSKFASSIVDDNLRYIDWQAQPAPKILTVADLPALLRSGKLFARKFDTEVDAGVLDELDEHLDSAEAVATQ